MKIALQAAVGLSPSAPSQAVEEMKRRSREGQGGAGRAGGERSCPARDMGGPWHCCCWPGTQECLVDDRGGGLEDRELEPESSLQQQNRPRPQMELRLAPSRASCSTVVVPPVFQQELSCHADAIYSNVINLAPRKEDDFAVYANVPPFNRPRRTSPDHVEYASIVFH
uniref:Uncharacterized protein n=1 Tax=Rangifer tarandus platyrhynchus TaxID=3082113 RepID=A0ACB0FNJ9_RANTA|nr:unnamed protein product [Rangifer tarandus platyrhynchus]